MVNPIRRIVLRIQNGWNNLFAGAEGEVRERQIPPEKTEDINEMIDRDRGYTLAKASREKTGRVKAEEAAKQTQEVDVSADMRRERERLSKQAFAGAFSLRKLFEYTEKGGEGVDVLSSDYKRNFGRFEDIWITKDGLLGVKTSESKLPVITGRTIKDIVRNYGNLNDAVKNGNFVVNLNADGNFAENVVDQEVPKVVVDDTGDIVTTKAVKEPFIKQLAQKERRIQQLLSDVKSTEEAWMGEHQERRRLQEHASMEKTARETLETDLSDTMESAENIMKNWGQKERENVQLQLGKKMAEDLTQVQESGREALLGKYEDWFEKKEIDMAKDEIQHLVDWTLAEMGLPEPEGHTPEDEG